jgi:hypothetical protein
VRRLLLLGRPDCHLCETFEQALLESLDPARFVLEHACVDDRGEWRMRYGRRIPVLLDDRGEVLAEGVFDRQRLDPDRTAAGDGA